MICYKAQPHGGSARTVKLNPNRASVSLPAHPLSPLVSRLFFFFFFTSDTINYQSSESQQVEICGSASRTLEGGAVFETINLPATFCWKEL